MELPGRATFKRARTPPASPAHLVLVLVVVLVLGPAFAFRLKFQIYLSPLPPTTIRAELRKMRISAAFILLRFNLV